MLRVLSRRTTRAAPFVVASAASARAWNWAGAARIGARSGNNRSKRVKIRNIIVAVSTVLVAGVIALSAAIYFSDQNLGAQRRHAAQSAPSTAATAPTTAPDGAPPTELAQARTPAPPAAPVRTETITYDAWTVSCRYAAKKVCSATLPMVAQQQNQQITVGAWIIARNNQGGLVSLVQTPQINIGVLLIKGMELKLGKGKPHKIGYVACNPQRCEGTMPMDDAVIREAIASVNNPVAISFWKADGAEFTINIQSIKGIDKAIAAVR
jgi:invasion protein IalB